MNNSNIEGIEQYKYYEVSMIHICLCLFFRDFKKQHKDKTRYMSYIPIKFISLNLIIDQC